MVNSGHASEKAGQRQRTVLTLDIPFAGKVGGILPPSSRAGVEVEEGSAGQLLPLPGVLAPGCRFAGRIIPRTSGKLASVWSPDAVNDAGGMNDCAVFVVPSRHGRIGEHCRGDQS